MKKSPLIFKEYSIQYEKNLQLSCSAVGAFAFRKYTYERITEIESRYLKDKTINNEADINTLGKHEQLWEDE